MGQQWKTFIEWLGASVNLIQLKLSEEQKIRFNERFAQLFGHAGFTHGGAMRSTVARIAINICRILSVVALLRATENSSRHTKQFSILNSPFSNAPVSPLPMTYRKRMSETVSYRNWT